MAINRQPVLKRCRKLGIEPAFLGINKKSKKKLAVTRKKISEYGLQLREKQKAKFVYGIQEKQFRTYFEKASKKRTGIVGENLLIMLECRLDNVIFRLGFGRTRKEARQIVSHGLLTVNGKKVDIPSFQVKVNDVIEIKEDMKQSPRFKDITDTTNGRRIVSWLNCDAANLKATVSAMPSREEIDTPVNETLIVELYSK